MSDGAYLRNDHENRLKQQGKFEVGTKPKKKHRVILAINRIAQTSREKPEESLFLTMDTA